MSEAPKSKKSYKELSAEIQALTKLAEAARSEELEAVVADIKDSIAAYKITAEQLGFIVQPAKPPQPPRKARSANSDNKPAKIELDADGNSIKYLADGVTRRPFAFFNPNGKEKAYNIGTRPAWLKALIASGVDASTYTLKL